jgi:hypothetical protein
VTVSAAQITVTGAEIASTTAGTGAGGPVMVATPGALVLDGMGIAPTQIAASATGSQSGIGRNVTVQANSGAERGPDRQHDERARQARRLLVSARFSHDPGR